MSTTPATDKAEQPQKAPLQPAKTYSGPLILICLSAVVAILSILLVPRIQLSAVRHLPLRSLYKAHPAIAISAAVKPSSVAQSLSSAHSSAKTLYTMPSKEDREWNRLADHMDQFHNHFRYEFNRVYTLADGGFHKQGMTLPRFLREAQQLSHHLDMHHRIESYIFPVLAKKMPQFKAGARESGEHLKKHKQIHDGLDRYDKFLSDALANPSSYDATALRTILDGFREVLFSHLDEEVHDLGAQSMKDAGWTLDEVRRIPM